MALQTSGAISLNQIHIEAGGSSGTDVTINDATNCARDRVYVTLVNLIKKGLKAPFRFYCTSSPSGTPSSVCGFAISSFRRVVNPCRATSI